MKGYRINFMSIEKVNNNFSPDLHQAKNLKVFLEVVIRENAGKTVEEVAEEVLKMKHSSEISELRETPRFNKERDGIVKLIKELGLMAITTRKRTRL